MLGLLVAALGLLMALAADVVASRAGASRVMAYATSLVIGLCCTLVFSLLLPFRVSLVEALIGLIAYGAWWFSFLNLVQALESSLRVRLLAEVRAAGGRISLAELTQRYDDATLLRMRLQRLRAGGAVVEQDGRLHVVSPGLRTIAGFFRFLKRILVGQSSEFEAPSA